jgi:hypothetical protein
MNNLPWVAWVPWFLILVAVGLAWWLRWRAPAVALGLLGAMVGEFIGAPWGSVHPGGALTGFLLLGAVGLLVFTPGAGVPFLVRAAAGSVLAGLAGFVLTGGFLRWACPAWAEAVEPRSRSWCFEGGPISFFVLFSGAAVALIFACSAVQASVADPKVTATNPHRAGMTRRRRGVVIAVSALAVLAFAAFIVADTPTPPRVDVSATSAGAWTPAGCRWVPHFTGGGIRKRCLSANGEGAFTLTLRNREQSDVIEHCGVQAQDADGKAIGQARSLVFRSRGRFYAAAWLHAGEATSLTWYVDGARADAIARYVATCSGYFSGATHPDEWVRT